MIERTDEEAKVIIDAFAYEAFRRRKPNADFTTGLHRLYQENRDSGLDVEAALVVRERYFRADLADRVAEGLSGAWVAPAIQLSGITSSAGGSVRTGSREATRCSSISPWCPSG